ncbi:MAG: IclR family transcriptional regulator [Verrucomicrobiales bacterium]|nr:IclR family transcriptional regulator [Verrucomicrobiales bacterium]
MKGKVGTLVKTMNLLNSLGEKGPMGVMDLSRSLDMDKSGVSRVLTTLKSGNYVRVLEDGRYDLGLRIFELGQILQERMPIRRALAPHVHALARDTGETAIAAHYHKRRISYLYDVIAEKEIRMGGRVGMSCVPWQDVCGKAILAFCDDDYILDCLKFDKVSGHSPLPSRKSIFSEVEKVRATGYAIERNRDQCLVAAHIPSKHRPPSLALMVGGPASRITTSDVGRLGELVKSHAEKCIESLGWPTESNA